MKTLKKAILTILILCSCIGCDQVTKSIARDRLSSTRPIYLMGDVFRFQYSENTGAFLSLGAALPEAVRFWALIVFVGLVLIGMLGFGLTSQEMNLMGTTGGALVVGGGFGNLIDRLFNNGAVVDFMNMGIGNLRTGVFNFADVAIMVGIGIMLVSGMFSSEDQEFGYPKEVNQ